MAFPKVISRPYLGVIPFGNISWVVVLPERERKRRKGGVGEEGKRFLRLRDVRHFNKAISIPCGEITLVYSLYICLIYCFCESHMFYLTIPIFVLFYSRYSLFLTETRI